MHLSAIGEYVDEQIRNVSAHYPYAEIPLWVVMPNHVHAIVVIDGDNVPYERRVTNELDAHTVETRRATSLQAARVALLRDIA